MKKVLLWVIANDTRFFQGAINILTVQHNGVDIVGVTANAPINLAGDCGLITTREWKQNISFRNLREQ